MFGFYDHMLAPAVIINSRPTYFYVHTRLVHPIMAASVYSLELHLLSSWPPSDARYLSLGEKDTACTLTMCNVSRQ